MLVLQYGHIIRNLNHSRIQCRWYKWLQGRISTGAASASLHIMHSSDGCGGGRRFARCVPSPFARPCPWPRSGCCCCRSRYAMYSDMPNATSPNTNENPRTGSDAEKKFDMTSCCLSELFLTVTNSPND